MNVIPVRSRTGPYRIFVGKNMLSTCGKLLKRAGLTGKVMIVSQPRIAELYGKDLSKALKASGFKVSSHLLPAGEPAKTIDELQNIYRALIDHDMERGDTIVALGGGVVGDAAGFAAATYLRGVPFVNIATTLLAQVDSAIGGKTAVNLGAGKNLVGAFYPPRMVLSDAHVLRTLPARELQASMGEVIKYGVIRDARLFGFLERSADKILSRDVAALRRIIMACSRVKALVVSRDEYETKGERMILNFGHTFGHAFEKALSFRKLMHGEAVAVGMVCAARMAVALKIFKASEADRIEKTVAKYKLPVSLSGLDIDSESVLYAMHRDKKKKAGKLRFILPARIGRVIVRADIPMHLVRDVVLEAGART